MQSVGDNSPVLDSLGRTGATAGGQETDISSGDSRARQLHGLSLGGDARSRHVHSWRLEENRGVGELPGARAHTRGAPGPEEARASFAPPQVCRLRARACC